MVRETSSAAWLVSRPAASSGRALVRYHLAVVRQRAGRYQFNAAAKPRDRPQRCRDLFAQCFRWRGAFCPQHHCISIAVTADDKAQSSQFGMPPADLGDLLGPDEHALDLGG